jgi:hypothetical protein
VSRDEVLAGRDRLLAYLAAHLHVDQRGAECASEPGGLDFAEKSEGFFVAAKLRFRCPRPIVTARFRYDLFFDLDPRHQGIARIVFGSGEGREQVFRDGARTLELRPELTVWDHVRQYLLLGVEHIFTGYDHVAFLFALLAIAGAHGLRAGFRRVVGVVTAFTVAHSATLIASALGSARLTPLRVVPAVALALATQILVEDRRRSPPAQRAARVLAAGLAGYFAAAVVLRVAPRLAIDPSRLVEASIALSIVYVAVENLVVPAPAHRFLLTFCFGLVHGFGFASVLREIGLPERGLLVSLLAFNAGVEIGQLTVVCAVLPLLALIVGRGRHGRGLAVEVASLLGLAVAMFALLARFDVPLLPLSLVVFVAAPALYLAGRRWGYDRAVRLGGSSLIAALATFWFFERVLGRSWLGGWLG